LYAKGTLHGVPASTDGLPIEDVLVVEHDVIPVDGADVFQQGGIDSIGEQVALAQDPGDLPELLRPRAILCKLSATKSTKTGYRGGSMPPDGL
jgi:hypothetical protein